MRSCFVTRTQIRFLDKKIVDTYFKSIQTQEQTHIGKRSRHKFITLQINLYNQCEKIVNKQLGVRQ